MYLDPLPSEQIVLFTLYGGSAVASIIACIYLCLRKSNAIAPDITPPLTLRRWAAALFASTFFSHVWWLLLYIYSRDIHSVIYVVTAVIDCMSLLICFAGTLLSMLQDRKRSVWPLIVAIIPYAVLLALSIPYSHFFDIAIVYILLVYVLFTIYMVFAVRQYGRWLRDNYADLEHKEVWTSHILVFFLLLLIISYGFSDSDIIVGYFLQFISFALFAFLLWRVETLPKLEAIPEDQEEDLFHAEGQQPCIIADLAVQATSLSYDAENLQAEEPAETEDDELLIQGRQPLNISQAMLNSIEHLLTKHCVNKKMYLQHDLNVHQLAQAIGTNRSYLSMYFSSKNTTYNAYINDLRINHFTKLFLQAVADQQSVIVAQQLARESGYQSYSTFSHAFKQRMGQSVTAWMRKTSEDKQHISH